MDEGEDPAQEEEQPAGKGSQEPVVSESQVERVYHDCCKVKRLSPLLHFMVGRSLVSLMKFQRNAGGEGLTESLNLKSELKLSKVFLTTVEE